jgi:hypothetical protein
MAFEKLREVLNRATGFGSRTLDNGSILLGHVPHVAPEAWLHQLYFPLNTHEIDELECSVKVAIPNSFREFLGFANGLGLFSGSLSIFGKRTSYARTGDEAWQPFCIVTANTFERPSYALTSQLIVGSYRSDGSLMLVDGKSERVIRCKSRSKKILNTWPDFSMMLTSEAIRLAELFDSNGRRLSTTATTPIPD